VRKRKRSRVLLFRANHKKVQPAQGRRNRESADRTDKQKEENREKEKERCVGQGTVEPLAQLRKRKDSTDSQRHIAGKGLGRGKDTLGRRGLGECSK